MAYRGAGVLFWRKGARGQKEVLLGLRSSSLNHAPSVWSTFGGGWEAKKDSTALSNALREAQEETAEGLGWQELPPQYFAVQPRCARRVWIPFAYGFSYWFVEVTVAAPGWPSLNWEHTKAAWYALDELPTPLHGETAKLLRLLKS